MPLSNRYDKTASIITPTKAENAVTGSISETDVVSVSSYGFMIYAPSAKTRELVRQEFGLNPESDVEFGAGDYDAALLKGTYLKDATNSKRYHVLGVRPQRGMQPESEAHHLHFIVREVPYA